MCVRVVVDASAFRHFREETVRSAGHQLLSWIRRGEGHVVYSASNTVYASELKMDNIVREILRDLEQAGLAIDVDPSSVQTALTQVPGRPVRRSNDPHILALAAAGKASILFSHDRKLREDFIDPQVLGKIGRKRRSSMPGLAAEDPGDTKAAVQRRKFLRNRKCSSRQDYQIAMLFRFCVVIHVVGLLLSGLSPVRRSQEECHGVARIAMFAG